MKTHEVVQTPIEALRPAAANARVHSKKQIKQIARSIQRYGFNAPVLVGDDGEIIAGHGRVEAAKLLGLDTIPAICLTHLNEIERRTYLIAYNKIALNAGWDQDLLAGEMQTLIDYGVEIEDTGFSMTEIDILLEDVNEPTPPSSQSRREEQVPELDKIAVSGRGDHWAAGWWARWCHKHPHRWGAIGLPD